MNVTLRRWRPDDAALAAEACADDYIAEGSAASNAVATEAGAARHALVADRVERLQCTVEPSIRRPSVSRAAARGLMRGYASWHGKRHDVLLYAKLAGD